MIKNIYFDMGGVIFDQNTEEAFRRFRSLGIDTDYYMGVYGQRDFFLDLETGRIDADTFCQRVGEVVGHAVSREQRATAGWASSMASLSSGSTTSRPCAAPIVWVC